MAAPGNPSLAPAPETVEEREPQPPYAFLEPYDTIEFQRVISKSPEALNKAFARKQTMFVVALSHIAGLSLYLSGVPSMSTGIRMSVLTGCCSSCAVESILRVEDEAGGGVAPGYHDQIRGRT